MPDGNGADAAELDAIAQAAREVLDPASDLEPVPVPDPSAEALRYHREGWWLWAFARFWSLAVPGVVLLSGLSARLRDTARGLAARLVPDAGAGGTLRRRAVARWLIVVAVFGLIYLGISAVLSLPLACYAGFVRPHAYGLSNRSFGRWLGVWAIDLGLTVALAIPMLWIVYGLIRWSPRRWWLWAGALALPVAFALALVKPALIDPLYHDFGPLRDPALEARILALADRVGVTGARVYQVDMSRDTRTVNAYVTGFLGTKRIVLWDTLTETLDEDEVLAVMAHELGHYVLGHVVRGLLVTSALILLGLYLVHRAAHWLLPRLGRRVGVENLADVATAPLLLALARLVALGLMPLGFAYSRHIEHEADRFALELTRDNRAAARAFVALQQTNLSHPRPARLGTWIRSTHPRLGDRIDFCNTYRPWTQGHPLRYGHHFSDPPTLIEAATRPPAMLHRPDGSY